MVRFRADFWHDRTNEEIDLIPTLSLRMLRYSNERAVIFKISVAMYSLILWADWTKSNIKKWRV